MDGVGQDWLPTPCRGDVLPTHNYSQPNQLGTTCASKPCNTIVTSLPKYVLVLLTHSLTRVHTDSLWTRSRQMRLHPKLCGQLHAAGKTLQ